METKNNQEEKRQRILARTEFERNKVLSKKLVTNYCSRAVWKKKLEETTDYKEIVSCLHYGLDEIMREDEGFSFSDTIKLYFDYSYGYDYYGSFSNRGEGMEDEVIVPFEEQGRSVYKNRKSLRQEIAKKAFSILCQKFLKDKTNGNNFLNSNYKPSWWFTLLDEDNGILSKVIEFFSFDKNIPQKDTDSHAEKIVIDFLYKLSTSAWVINFYGYNNCPPIILVKNRHHFIRFLWGIGELHFLIKNWALLSLEDVETIKKIAYSSDSYSFSFGEPLVSEEIFKKAFLDGKNIAVFYNTLVSILKTQLSLYPTERVRLLSVEEQIKIFQK